MKINKILTNLSILLLVSFSSCSAQEDLEFQFVSNGEDVDIFISVPVKERIANDADDNEQPVTISPQPKESSSIQLFLNDDLTDDVGSTIDLMPPPSKGSLPITQNSANNDLIDDTGSSIDLMPSSPKGSLPITQSPANEDLTDDIGPSVELMSPAEQKSPSTQQGSLDGENSNNDGKIIPSSTRESPSTIQFLSKDEKSIDEVDKPTELISFQPQETSSASKVLPSELSNGDMNNDSTELSTSQPQEMASKLQGFSNEIIGPTTIDSFSLVLSPISEDLDDNSLATLRWTVGSLLSQKMTENYSHGTGNYFQKMSRLEVVSVEYFENVARRRNRRRLSSRVKVDIAGPSFFFEGGWGGAVPSPDELGNIVENMIMSDDFKGALRSTSDPQLSRVQSISFGFSSAQFSPTNIPTQDETQTKEKTNEQATAASGPSLRIPLDDIISQPVSNPAQNPTKESTLPDGGASVMIEPLENLTQSPSTAEISTSPAEISEPNVEKDIKKNAEKDIDNDKDKHPGKEVDKGAENNVEKSAEENIENSAEKNSEKGVEKNIENNVEKSAESIAQNVVEKSTENNVEKSAEENIENNVEKSAEENIENNVENNSEKGVEKSAEKSTVNNVENNSEKGVEKSAEKSKVNNVEKNVEKISEESAIKGPEEGSLLESDLAFSNLKQDDTIVELEKTSTPMIAMLCFFSTIGIFALFFLAKREQKMEHTPQETDERPNGPANSSSPDRILYIGRRRGESRFQLSEINSPSSRSGVNTDDIESMEFEQDNSWDPDDDLDDEQVEVILRK